MAGHAWNLTQYVVVFELDGIKHVGGHRGVEPKDIEAARFKSAHPRIKILYFEPQQTPDQPFQFVKELAKDENWAPLTPQQFAASAAAAMKEQANVPSDHPALTNEPGATKLPAILVPQAAKDAQPAEPFAPTV